MKKTLALILAMLVAFSMFSVAAVAVVETDNLVSVQFVDYDGKEIRSASVTIGDSISAYAPDDPVRENTDKAEYTFAGWKSNNPEDTKVYSKYQLPAATENVIYTATYSEEKVTAGQNLLQFFRSIFERINLIFQYFATIFNFDTEA